MLFYFALRVRQKKVERGDPFRRLLKEFVRVSRELTVDRLNDENNNPHDSINVVSDRVIRRSRDRDEAVPQARLAGPDSGEEAFTVDRSL